MDANLRWVYLSYGVGAVLLAVVLAKVLGVTAGLTGLPDPEILGEQLTASGVAAVLITAIALGVVLRHARLRAGSVAVVAEVRKVTWPTREETKSATVVVVVTSVLFGVFLGVSDLFWAWLSGLIY